MLQLQKRISDNKAECLLCPHNCRLEDGKAGICGVRKNTGGRIELQTYGILSACSLDPMEKKPLYHFFPGYNILSVGSYGCNMRCDFCQNYSISQTVYQEAKTIVTPESLVKTALEANRNIGLAFTYNEPVIWFEYMRDAALMAKSNGMYTAMISNGYVNSDPLREILNFIDAFNIDLKSFNNTFYKKLTGATLEPVKNALRMIAESGKHLEITTLIIPGQNDNEREMELETEWIACELGKNVPFHLSRYFPRYRRTDPTTPDDTMLKLYEIASGKLNYVYFGNTESDTGQNTGCPECGLIVTKRSGYNTSLLNLDQGGRCTGCGNLIYRNLTIAS
ncbi:MAG: AmmeMemoRadiSam system radical SAM enzyme [Bacteroidetes bacterium GWC2_40_22]|nr:MAG: AmmeMemoRadiSam system radical SAM enzyme [Bacteroidetes bacterium GWC2_40_22]